MLHYGGCSAPAHLFPVQRVASSLALVGGGILVVAVLLCLVTLACVKSGILQHLDAWDADVDADADAKKYLPSAMADLMADCDKHREGFPNGKRAQKLPCSPIEGDLNRNRFGSGAVSMHASQIQITCQWSVWIVNFQQPPVLRRALRCFRIACELLI